MDVSTSAKRKDRINVFPDSPAATSGRPIDDDEIRERIWNAIVDRSLLPACASRKRN